MSSPYVLFCRSPLAPRAPEPDYALEADVARACGFTPVLVDHDELDQRIEPEAAIRSTRFDGSGVAVYRGWMLQAEAYARFFEVLSSRGIHLLTSPAAYAACHHAPGSYSALSKWMPLTKWLAYPQIDDRPTVETMLASFGPVAIIVKDWVKSQATGYWKEACYIRDASNFAAAWRVIMRFRELQGDSLTGGLVFKSYVSLLPVERPAYEYRAFVVDGKIVGCWPRSDGAASHAPPPEDLQAEVAAHIPSPFASADFGIDANGTWWLLEVGDGQVSGLPSDDAAGAIYSALHSAVQAQR